MILAILAIWFGYRKARDTGRNPFLWAAICGGTFIGVQLLVGFGIGVILGVGVEAFGWSETVYEDYNWVYTICAMAASILSVYLLFRYLDRIPAEEPTIQPPPPPTFDQ